MANLDQPVGFRPAGSPLRLRPYLVAAGQTVRQGDCVKRSAGVAGGNGDNEIAVATAGAAMIGVAAHYALAGEKVMVWDHPDQEFVGQADDATIDQNADIGLNASILATAGARKLSAHEIDASSVATTATLELKVLRVLPAIDNALGAQVKCVVKINNHQLAASTGSAGV